MVFASIALIRRAFRRSRIRVGSLLVLLDLGEASVADIADALGADLVNVRGALVGDGVRYRVEESLVTLGLVVVRVVGAEVVFVLSRRGVLVARRLRRERSLRSGRSVAPVLHST